MIPNLPPLQTLRAFEAAARHLSYTRAGEELGLTHGAISHHIARLEGDLGGIRLFVRDGNSMRLTDAGRVLVADMRVALHLLADAVQNARGRTRLPARRRLGVSVLPSFASQWLVPRLQRFQAQCPDIDVVLHATAALATLDRRDGIDVAIRYGAGRWHGLHARLLMPGTLFAVCSPALSETFRLMRPADLLGAPRLRNARQKWRPWLLAAGLDGEEPETGPIYDDAALLVQAAAADQGVALARAALVTADLASGRLVRLFDVEVEDDYAWFAVWREPARCAPDDIAAFRGWLEQEAAAG